MAYIGWLTSSEGQKIIREFGKMRLVNHFLSPPLSPKQLKKRLIPDF